MGDNLTDVFYMKFAVNWININRDMCSYNHIMRSSIESIIGHVESTWDDCGPPR